MKKTMALSLLLIFLFSLPTPALAWGENDTIAITISPASTELTPIDVPKGSTVELTADTLVTTTIGTVASLPVYQDTWNNALEVTGATGTGPAYTSTATFDTAQWDVGSIVLVTYQIVLYNGRIGFSGNWNSMEESFVKVTGTTTVAIRITPMAAPGVADRILSFNGLKPAYRDGRTTGNFIADVAGNMETGAGFEGISKAVWSDYFGMDVSNPAYREAVLAYLNGHPMMMNPLLMPPDEYFEEP